MAIYDYNSRIKFDLPKEYVFEKGVNSKGEKFTRILTGEDGEGDYDFYCYVDLIEYSSSNSDSVEILEFSEETESTRIIKISRFPSTYIKALRSSYSFFGNVYNTFELTGQIKLSDGVVLELINRTMDGDDGVLDETSAIQRFFNVLKFLYVDGKKLQLDKHSPSALESELKSNGKTKVKDVQVNISFGSETSDSFSDESEDVSDSGFPFSEQEVLDKGPACGIWLLLGQITALCKSTKFFTDEDIRIIKDGLTTHELLMSVILQRDPALYELALESKKVAASFMLGVLADNGKKAISVFEKAKDLNVPDNFEKAFILISLFFDIPYSPAASLPIERKREIMQDCRGFINSVQIILSMEGFQYKLPEYCQPDSVSVYRIDSKPQKQPDATSEKSIQVYQVYDDQCEIENGVLRRFWGKQKSIRLPEGITEIADSAFLLNHNIECVIVPDGVKRIGSSFHGCDNLTYILLPDTLEFIGKWAFLDCKKLKSLEVPSGVRTIETDALQNCPALEYILIPSSVTEMGINLYQSDRCIMQVERGSEAEKFVKTLYRSGDRIVYEKPKGLVSFPNYELIDTQKAAENADEAFVIRQDDPNVSAKGNQLLRYNNDKVVNIEISGDFDSIGKLAFSCSKSLEYLILAEGVVEIKESAFSLCKNLKRISFPASLRKIGKDAFMFCESIEEIRIPEGVNQIGSGAFNCCKKLKKVYLPASLEKIVGNAWLIAQDAEFFVPQGSYAEEYVTKKYKYAKIHTI